MIEHRLSMSTTILIAVLLHVGLLLWLSPSQPVPLPILKQPIKISLLAMVSDTTTQPLSTSTKKITKPEPVIQPKPVKSMPPAEKKRNTLKSEPKEKPVEKTKELSQTTPNDTKTAKIDTAATARYEALLVAWLEKFKKYPLRAKRLRIEGEGHLKILIKRSGKVIRVNLAERTGSRLLDKAALEMVKRANPFPPIPENDPRQSLEFIVPVAFLLR